MLRHIPVLLLSLLAGCASRTALRGGDSSVPPPAKTKGPSEHLLALQRQMVAKEAAYHEAVAKLLDDVPKLAADKVLVSALDALIGQEYWQKELHALIEGSTSVRKLLNGPNAERFALRQEVSRWVGSPANLATFVQADLEEHPETADGQSRAGLFLDAVGIKLIALLPLQQKWDALGEAYTTLQDAQRDFGMQLAFEGLTEEALAVK